MTASSNGSTRPCTLADLLGGNSLFVDGDWVESKDQDPAGDVRLIQLADVGDGYYVNKSARFLTRQKAQELKCTFLHPGDILIARMPDPVGRACIFPGDAQACVTVVDVCIIRTGGDIDRRWLLQGINSPIVRHQIAPHIKGATRQRVSRTNLGTILLDVPPLPEQRRVADILDKADAIRRKRKEAIALTEELLRSAFLEMFGDPVTNPKGWKTDALGNLIVLKSGDFLPAKAMDAAGPYPVYGGNGVNGYHSSYMFKERIIAIGRVGVYCGAVHRTEPTSWVTDNALYVAKHADTLHTTYLEHALRLANLNQYANQAAQPLISGSRIYPVAISVPPP